MPRRRGSTNKPKISSAQREVALSQRCMNVAAATAADELADQGEIVAMLRPAREAVAPARFTIRAREIADEVA